MNQMLDLGETDSLAKDVDGLEDWFEAAVQTSVPEILPKRTAIRSSWGDDDEEVEDDDLPEEATPEQEDQIEPVDDGMLEGHPDAEALDEELDENGNPIVFPDDE